VADNVDETNEASELIPSGAATVEQNESQMKAPDSNQLAREETEKPAEPREAPPQSSLDHKTHDDDEPKKADDELHSITANGQVSNGDHNPQVLPKFRQSSVLLLSKVIESVYQNSSDVGNLPLMETKDFSASDLSLKIERQLFELVFATMQQGHTETEAFMHEKTYRSNVRQAAFAMEGPRGRTYLQQLVEGSISTDHYLLKVSDLEEVSAGAVSS